MSLQEYIYTYNSDTIYLHLYIPSEAKFEINGETVEICQESNYPLIMPSYKMERY